MFRILLIVSVIPIVFVMLATWWFGTRVLWLEGKRKCRCNLESWLPDPEDKNEVHRSDATAKEFGIQLRKKALMHWKEQSPKIAKAREGNRAFGMAVPPLSAVIAVFATLVGRIPPFGAIAIFAVATAASTIIGMLSLPSELTAIRRYIQSGAIKGSFPNSYDEESVIACALAQVWDSNLPPILRWFQSGGQTKSIK